VLIIGGGLAGLAAARELRGRFRVTVVDAKEYFEFTSGILRAYAKPSHWDALTFQYHTILERNFGVGFIWGEVTKLDGENKVAHVKSMFSQDDDIVPYDYCVIASGCNFNQTVQSGESPWFPSVHNAWRSTSEFRHLDERFLEGRRRRILEENDGLQRLNKQQANVLIVGAGFMGVEWACELRHFFPGLLITLSDFLPRCLGPLPDDAANYCEEYMKRNYIKTKYGAKYDPKSDRFWTRVELPERAAKTYIVTGVKHSNYFMPSQTLSEQGPGGGGWILMNKRLQVVNKKSQIWGQGVVFVTGDCMWGCIGESRKWELPPVPKTGYPAEEQAVHVSRNVKLLDLQKVPGTSYCCCLPLPGCCIGSSMMDTWYPWGAGIFAISLGPQDGCIVTGNTDEKNTGRLRFHGQIAAAQKELIEATKMAHLRGDHGLASLIWYVIHHWPINLWGRGPCISWGP